jgi:glyceraldehyde 3-phosphate dehydrogenase
VAINGFGRIGRAIARVIFSRNDIKLVAINDLEKKEDLEYLLKYDSTHGVCNCNLKDVKIYNEIDNSKLNFGEVDVVFECTGRNLTTEKVVHHLKKGAKKVIISAPSEDNTPT